VDGRKPSEQHQVERLQSFGHVNGNQFAICTNVSSLTIFIIGFVILVAGLAYGASLAGLSPQWIAVGVLVLLGMGVAMGVTRTRQRDPSQTS
jgi:predicted signal transduction protein with EAL and GGDEF domain